MGFNGDNALKARKLHVKFIGSDGVFPLFGVVLFIIATSIWSLSLVVRRPVTAPPVRGVAVWCIAPS